MRGIKQFRENARGTGIAVGMVMTNQTSMFEQPALAEYFTRIEERD